MSMVSIACIAFSIIIITIIIVFKVSTMHIIVNLRYGRDSLYDRVGGQALAVLRELR